MFEMLYILIAVVGSLAVGIYDLKTSDVPDLVVYFMTAAGLGLHFVEAITLNNMSLFTDTLIVGAVFFVIGAIMYYTKQWGDGDSALLVAIGVLTATFTTTFFPFALSFFINLAIIGAFYSILYAMIMATRNGSDKIFFKELRKEKKKIVNIMSMLLPGFIVVAIATSTYQFILFPFVIAIAFLFYLFIKAIDKGFRKKISVSKLKEGDVIGEDIPRAKIYSKYIRGLTKKDIAKIKRHKKHVIVLDGIRYTPAFALALIFTLLYGDVVTLLFL